MAACPAGSKQGALEITSWDVGIEMILLRLLSSQGESSLLPLAYEAEEALLF